MSYSDEILDLQEERYEHPDRYLASTGLRFANYLLDRIGMYIFIIGFVFLLEALKSQSTTYMYSVELSNVELILMLTIMLTYWIIPEYLWGKTPAKFLTRTKVVTKSGKRPTFMTIVGRTLCRFIPFEPFSFLGSKPVGWHDSISNTRVVMDEYKVQEDYY